jgi:hypothetical protein
MLHAIILSLKADVAFKITMDQTLIVIYPKFNSDFKSHNNFKG